MTALCQICAVAVIGPAQAERHAIDPESEQGRIIDFDALASHMWLHISEFHPNQMQEGIMVQRRAVKMYATNWMKLDAGQELLRIEHRKQVLVSLTVTTLFEGDQAAGSEGSASADDPEGSNVKKSVKNTSN